MENTPACFALSLLLTATMSNGQVRQPSAVESAVAIQVKHHLTIGESQYRNPLSASIGNVRRGQEVFPITVSPVMVSTIRKRAFLLPKACLHPSRRRPRRRCRARATDS